MEGDINLSVRSSMEGEYETARKLSNGNRFNDLCQIR